MSEILQSDLGTGRLSVVADRSLPPVAEGLLYKRRLGMVCSRAQAKIALLEAGLLDAVEAQFVAATETQRLAWTEAQDFYRLSPMLTSMGAALGLTDAELDNLFTAAMRIQI